MSLFESLEDIGDDGLVADAAAGSIGLLCARFRQAIHRFDRAQDVDMRDALAFGICIRFESRLDVGTREDGNDPIL